MFTKPVAVSSSTVVLVLLSCSVSERCLLARGGRLYGFCEFGLAMYNIRLVIVLLLSR